MGKQIGQGINGPQNGEIPGIQLPTGQGVSRAIGPGLTGWLM